MVCCCRNKGDDNTSDKCIAKTVSIKHGYCNLSDIYIYSTCFYSLRKCFVSENCQLHKFDFSLSCYIKFVECLVDYQYFYPYIMYCILYGQPDYLKCSSCNG